MQPDLILIPFAENAASGNIDDIPETLSPSDPPQAASWSAGFPPVTMTPLAAGGIPPRGQSFNGVLNAISQHIVYQGGGGQYTWSAEYVAEKGGYPKGAVIQSDDGSSSYRSAVDNNTVNFNTTPGSIGVQWMPWAGGSIGTQPDATTSTKGIVRLATNPESISGESSTIAVTPSGLAAAIAAATPPDKVNAPVATVAAAANIDLTSGAPATSQLAISGTGASIAGFTVAANRFFVVKMTGASNTLVNSASLVTGRGANIKIVAGDTFFMRSTAANTVEILCGNFLCDAAVCTRGQTYQDVKASRLLNTSYTNSTGRTIFVSVSISARAGDENANITVGGVVAAQTINNGTAGEDLWLGAFVPDGAVYSVNAFATLAIGIWSETR